MTTTITDEQVEAAALEIFQEHVLNAQSAPWHRQPEPTKNYTRKIARAALTAAAQFGKPAMEICDQCQGSGFSGNGTGYGNVCGKCGGQGGYPAPATPGRADDWQLVPKVPNTKMIHAGDGAGAGATGKPQQFPVTENVWSAMLAASPSQPARITKELAEAKEEIERLKDELFNAQTSLP